MKSIHKLHGSEIWLDSNPTAAVMRQFAPPGEIGSAGPGKARPLSYREREIVQLVAQGYKNKDMAKKMFISEQTVKNHLHKIFYKLGVSGRLELALYAMHKGLNLRNTESGNAIMDDETINLLKTVCVAGGARSGFNGDSNARLEQLVEVGLLVVEKVDPGTNDRQFLYRSTRRAVTMVERLERGAA